MGRGMGGPVGAESRRAGSQAELVERGGGGSE